MHLKTHPLATPRGLHTVPEASGWRHADECVLVTCEEHIQKHSHAPDVRLLAVVLPAEQHLRCNVVGRARYAIGGRLCELVH